MSEKAIKFVWFKKNFFIFAVQEISAKKTATSLYYLDAANLANLEVTLVSAESDNFRFETFRITGTRAIL
jgi:hypothetical protein